MGQDELKEKKTWIIPVIFRRPEKTSSVKLLQGFLSKNPGDVIVQRCRFCHTKPELLAVNLGDPRLRLYGCKRNDKCKKILIRFMISEKGISL